MSMNQPVFQSLRNIRDNTLLLSIANEYIGENVYLLKIGTEIKKNLSVLKEDIKTLKKQFPGKFATEIDTDTIISSFEKTTEDMLSGEDRIKTDCASGKLGLAFSEDVNSITEAVEKIWLQVKGSDLKYTKTDSLNNFLGRMDIFSGVIGLISRVAKILLIFFIIAGSGFSYLYFTMEKEEPIIKENEEITAFIEEKKAQLIALEEKKTEAQKSLKKLDDGKLLRKDKITIIDLETRIQEFNQQIHLIEGEIDSQNRSMLKNKERLEEIKGKSFLNRLLKK